VCDVLDTDGDVAAGCAAEEAVPAPVELHPLATAANSVRVTHPYLVWDRPGDTLASTLAASNWS
jgi:hypothetical protein